MQVSVIASLVVGVDGSTSPSNVLTNHSDRASFLALRSQMDCIITGGETFRSESYQRTPVPLIVISRTLKPGDAKNPAAHIWNLDPAQALSRAREEFGPQIHVECGGKLLVAMLNAKLIDELQLTITDKSGGENFIDSEKCLRYFERIEKLESGEYIRYLARQPR